MLQSDLLLQQILEQGQKQNDALIELKKAIIDTSRGSGGSGGNGGGNNGNRRNNRNNNGQDSIFKQLRRTLSHGAMNAGSNLVANNSVNSAQGAVKGFGAALDTAGNLLGMLPGPIGKAGQALTMLAKAGVAAYEWLNAQHQLYQDINSSGVALADGFMSLRKGASSSLMSVDQLSKVIKNNSTAFSAMNDVYGDGVDHFGKLMNSVQDATNAAGQYGISQDLLADITAKNFKMQKLYGLNDQLNDVKNTQSTAQFVEQLNTMSKVMGTSIQELLKKVDDFMGGSGGMSLEAAYEVMNGYSKEMSQKMTKGLSTALSSMGKAGESIRDQFATFKVDGVVDTKKWGAATGVVRGIFDGLNQLGSKVQDPKEVQKVVDKYIKNDSNRAMLQRQLLDAQRMGNQEMVQQITALLQYNGLASKANEQTAKAASGWDGLVSRFNKWMGDVVKPIKDFFDNTLDNIGNWLLGIADSTSNPMQFLTKMASDMVEKFNQGVEWLFDKVLDIPKALIGAIIGDDLAGKMKDRAMQMLHTVLEFPLMVGNFIRDLLFGSSDQVKESATAIKDGVLGFFGNIVGSFKDLFSFDDGIEGIRKNINAAWDAMKSKVSGFWDKLKSWFGRPEKADPKSSQAAAPVPKSSPVTASTKPKNQPVAVASTANPVQVQPKEEKEEAPQAPKSAAETSLDDLLRALNKVAQSSGKTNDNLTNLSNYLRTIASNTTPERNV